VFVAQFIIGKENKGFAVFFKLVARAAIGMAQGDGGDDHRSQLMAGVETGFVIRYSGANVIKIDREIRRRHQAGKQFFDGCLSERASPDAEVDLRKIDRLEKGKPMM